MFKLGSVTEGRNIIAAAKMSFPHRNYGLTGQMIMADDTAMNCCAFPASRDEALEADLKSLLYYFRHHTVEPEILKRLCFVEIVYSLQNHANRCGSGFKMKVSQPFAVYMSACLPKACTSHDSMNHPFQIGPFPNPHPPANELHSM